MAMKIQEDSKLAAINTKMSDKEQRMQVSNGLAKLAQAYLNNIKRDASKQISNDRISKELKATKQKADAAKNDMKSMYKLMQARIRGVMYQIEHPNED